MHRWIVRTAAALALGFAAAGGTRAEDSAYTRADNDGSESKFYVRSQRAILRNETVSTRSRALGGSYAALSNGAAGVLENPAALGAQTDRELTFDIGVDEIESGDESATWVTVNAGGAANINACDEEYWPRESIGNHTVGVMVRSSGIDYDKSNGLDAGNDGIILAYGRSFLGGRAFGGASLAIDGGDLTDDDRLIDRQIDSIEVKLGAIYRPSRPLALGGTFTYGRGDFTDEGSLNPGEGDMERVGVRWGAAYQLSRETLVLGDIAYEFLDQYSNADDMEETHNIWRVSIGAEQTVVPETLSLRGGLYYLHDEFKNDGNTIKGLIDDVFGLTGGFAYRRGKTLEFGYTFDWRVDGELGHFLHFEYDW